MSKIVKKKLKINGMHCTACSMNIDFDLEDLKGIKSAKTNYAKSETEIEFDEQEIQIEAIVLQIEKTGYQAEPKQE